MALRSTWKGHLRLSLVSVPVASYPAISSSEGRIHFHQLHDQCHNRIKYVKTCPVHGPVAPDEIVSGYEFEKGQFVVIEKGELTALRSAEEKVIEVQTIADSAAIDPLYLTEHTLYLVPEGKPAQKPYHVIQRCLSEQKRVAIAHRVVNGKDELVLIRPVGTLLIATTLANPQQVRDQQPLQDLLTDVTINASELKLTRTLFDAFYQKSVDLSQFKDEYDERVLELVQSKSQGRKVLPDTTSEPQNVINLMDALKRSLQKSKPGPTSPKAQKETTVPNAKRQIVAAKRKKAKRA